MSREDQHGNQRRDRRSDLVEAERVLADRVDFALGKQQWAKLNEMLDRPARVPPGLARLFARPSVCE